MKNRTTPPVLLQKLACLAASLVFALGFALPAAAAAPTPAPKRVRVGYFAFEGYHNQDVDGNRSGYGYEYLQQMARYTGWTYDYIGYDSSWSDAQQMLERGEIDLLTSAQKTPAREEIFDFSTDPIGYSSTIFSIKAGNTDYTIDNFSSFNGVRVGMIEGNSRNDQFREFAAERDFTYVPVLFDNMAALVEALQNGTIGAIVTSSLRATNGEWVVSSFGVSPYYVCVKKGNTALLEEVNTAIAAINQNNPGIQNELENKYYGTDSSGGVAFTEAERRYIESRNAEGRPLTVLLNPDRAPLTSFAQGTAEGILSEAVVCALELSGLPYELIETADRTAYAEAKAAHTAEICADMRFDLNAAEGLGYRLTDPYYTASISRVTLDTLAGAVKSVATVENSDISVYLQQQMFGDAALTYYPTTADCLRAVEEGRQDAAYVYTYVAEEALARDSSHRLIATLMPDFTTQFSLGLGDTSDVVLFSILNKCVTNLDASWLDAVTLSYTGQGEHEVTLADVVYAHPVASGCAVLLLVVLLLVLVALIFRQHARRKDAERAAEIQRLFRYVCKEHEKVMEVNLQTMTAREYILKGNTLCREDRAFRTDGNLGGFMHPDDYAELSHHFDEQTLHRLIETGGEYVFEARGREPDGSYHWYIYTIYGILPDKLHPSNFMLFKHDITELKRKEEESRAHLKDALALAQQASLAKGTFLSRMSHEIRTPLNAVIGYMQIAKDSADNPEKMMHCVENSEVAARHLLSIINDVLDISSIESGKMKLANEPFDLKSQIGSISTLFFNQAKAKDVRFEARLDDVTQEMVVGDSLRLNQILMNLLSNAVKFTPAGGQITLTVAQFNADKDSVYMKFSVGDTGIGMSEEYLSRMFKPFEQENAGTAQKYGGTGLGLSITHNLVQMMGGSMDVTSKPGEGSTFVVTLRFGRGGALPTPALPQDYSRVRALVVDDDEVACEYMKALFKRCKLKCDVVGSGAAALRQLRRRAGTDYAYDLCIIDWNMPEMNGIETARRIKAEFGSKLPIIIATAYDVTEFEDEAKAVGVDKVIAKPLFQSTMFDLLVSTFGKYQPALPEEEKNEDIKGLHLLLAEDNVMNREIAVDILTKAGLTVDTAEDGKQACDLFTASPAGRYDAILMDVQMPVMNGYEATGVIRKSGHPQAKTVPILAMTANAFAEDVNAALAAGMNGHIAKPVEYKKLYQALRDCMGKSKA